MKNLKIKEMRYFQARFEEEKLDPSLKWTNCIYSFFTVIAYTCNYLSIDESLNYISIYIINTFRLNCQQIGQ